ncbi:hypothetical protein [Desulfobacula toluolica]|uniref:hypothetical protein n=1 Tax=Desulfobacula toluolica TaxID=28223 RepID=UPI0002FFBB8F|nr:hypothetical protein [Desulfobacula toluolica]
MLTQLSGDNRLPERFRTRALVSLGSRIRFRLKLEPYTREELLDYMDYWVCPTFYII